MPQVGHCYFEQPLNECIRSFLRLEHLIECFHYHAKDMSEFGRRACLKALLDILTLLSQQSIRTNLAKIFGSQFAETQRQIKQGDDSEQTRQQHEKIGQIRQALNTIPPHFAAQQLQENGLLKSLVNRHAIPGGSCAFDIPSYKHWLRQDEDDINQSLAHWFNYIVPFEQAITVLLAQLRSNAEQLDCEAKNGVFLQQMAPQTQLICIQTENCDVYPEISAGRHRTTIRFMEYYGETLQVRQVQSTVHFQLTCCQL